MELKFEDKEIEDFFHQRNSSLDGYEFSLNEKRMLLMSLRNLKCAQSKSDWDNCEEKDGIFVVFVTKTIFLNFSMENNIIMIGSLFIESSTN